MIIETERLLFRELTEYDFDALYAILGDSEVMQYYPSIFDEQKVRAWIQNNMERAYGCIFMWAFVVCC